MAVAVAAQQLGETAIEAPDRRDWRVGVLHGINVGVAVAVEIPGDQTLQRRDLRQAGQGCEAVGAVGLAQEDAAAKLGCRKTPGVSQLRLPENLVHRGPCVILVAGIALQDRGNRGGQTAAAAPG